MTELLEVRGLTKRFKAGAETRDNEASPVYGVQNASFTLTAGKTLAIVGETGAGKSTIGRLVLRLIEAEAGTITFDGVDVRAQSGRALRQMRAKMRMIFQDPFSSLDPTMSVGAAVEEPLRLHTSITASERRSRALELFDRVGLSADAYRRRPHEFSGGQLQRIAIAKALTTNPSLVVCDEAVAALDMSIRAQVLGLLGELQSDLGLAYLFITHDLALVRLIAHDVIVMRSGRLVEQGSAATVFESPQEPYTKELLAAIPAASPETRTIRPPVRRPSSAPQMTEPPRPSTRTRTRDHAAGTPLAQLP